MGIDTLEMMMQYDQRLNYEIYESVTILLYQHYSSASHAVTLSCSYLPL